MKKRQKDKFPTEESKSLNKGLIEGFGKNSRTTTYSSKENERRDFGAHLTSVEIFRKYIFPEIKDILYDYCWVDLFSGEGNLILPILEGIPKSDRIDFFKERIFLFDIQEEMVKKAIQNAQNYGIPYEIAKTNIQIRDSIQNYPDIQNFKYPPFHITNPPYLYIGYIVKNSERNLKYFSGLNQGFQDLYQIALINDLRHKLEKMVYIIPTNFLFGFSVSNKIRKEFFPFYRINKAIIFERKIFEFTGTNVCICFFERKKEPSEEPIFFRAKKVNSKTIEREYHLTPRNFYRAGGEFDEFVNQYKSPYSLKIKFYLTLNEVEKNKGDKEVKLLDVNNFSSGYLKSISFFVNDSLYRKLQNNPLFVRTLDTGDWDGRVGIYNAKETFGVDGLVVTKDKYRTHPIQIFLSPEISPEGLILLKDYFNLMLEYFRDITDSEFLTTFKYSNSCYVRKYLGLSQTKKLLETFPLPFVNSPKENEFKILVQKKDIEGIKEALNCLKGKNENQIFLFNLKNE